VDARKERSRLVARRKKGKRSSCPGGEKKNKPKKKRLFLSSLTGRRRERGKKKSHEKKRKAMSRSTTQAMERRGCTASPEGKGRGKTWKGGKDRSGRGEKGGKELFNYLERKGEKKKNQGQKRKDYPSFGGRVRKKGKNLVSSYPSRGEKQKKRKGLSRSRKDKAELDAGRGKRRQKVFGSGKKGGAQLFRKKVGTFLRKGGNSPENVQKSTASWFVEEKKRT